MPEGYYIALPPRLGVRSRPPNSRLRNRCSVLQGAPCKVFFRQLHGCGTYEGLILKNAGVPAGTGPAWAH